MEQKRSNGTLANVSANQLMIALLVAGLTMALVVYISNVLVQTPITWLNANWFNYGQFTFPIAFLVTDIVNRLFGAKRAYIVIAVGFVVGGIMSMAAGDVRVGIASISAFAIGQYLDVNVFNRLRDMIWWIAPLVSSVFASFVDTVWFYTVAFAGTDLPWMQWGTVDFFVKVAVAMVALVPFRLVIARWFATRATA